MAELNRKTLLCCVILALAFLTSAHAQITPPPPPGPPAPPGFPIDAGLIGILAAGLFYGIRKKVKK